ncbi:unnamed protein product [Bursaphelenchus xylophilus]|uniref:(pine wood nematode) hypothetical protein n=1 Tax=Bursaphelenchus xylophilus TaxID=6326 RepID=A0A1I7RX63_BURXY|nr:unnamed protein product [Bursaphelenchus xylophilus]CAG9121355.1 unnamed protein product [Bursaphelenchus xylophilus]
MSNRGGAVKVKREERGGGGRRDDRKDDRPPNQSKPRPKNDDRPRGGVPQGDFRMPDKNAQSFTLEIPRKKFTGRCRLFVGNLPNDLKEEELKKMFVDFGEINECYLSGKGFAFLRLDTRAHAEAAKETLDGKTVKGRQLRVRFAVHGAALRVKELSACVSNEMLYHTFSVFGEVERAIHIVDERGKPTGEGIIEFERKSSAQEALKNIEERVFIMSAQSHPLRAEMLEPKDDEDGLAERMIQRTPQTVKEREVAPHFADLKSFEFVYGQRWKELYRQENERRAQLEEELKAKRRQLEADLEIEYEDYRAQMIREDLERQKRELERLEALKRERVRAFPQGPPRFPGDDGPHGRPPPTYGRDPGRGGPDLDVNKILNSFRGGPDMGPPMGFDPHAMGVQRSLQKSLGLGEPLGPPPMGPPPGGPGPYGAPPRGFFNGPPGFPPGMAPPGGPVPLSSLGGHDYRPDIKRQRR